MRHGPKSLITALSSLSAVAAVALVPASPSAAEPGIAEVRERVDTLYREAEIASERYNDARIELRSVRKDLRRLRADQRRQQRVLDVVQGHVEDSVVRQYEGESVSGVSRVLVADDPQAFVEQLTVMDAYNEMQQAVFADFADKSERLSAREAKMAKRAEKRADIESQLAADKAEIDEKASEAAALLERLEQERAERLAAQRERERERAAAEARREQERAEQVSRSRSREQSGQSSTQQAQPEQAEQEQAEQGQAEQGQAEQEQAQPEVQSSGGAAAAVAYARAQVGKSYVYGAAGPSSFDCSGLTMMAWSQGGVSLPHSSGAQMSAGTPVSRSELQPGDLVFYYSPVSHVGIYAGNGQLVHAANPSTGVSVTSVDSMPFSGAVRPG